MIKSVFAATRFCGAAVASVARWTGADYLVHRVNPRVCSYYVQDYVLLMVAMLRPSSGLGLAIRLLAYGTIALTMIHPVDTVWGQVRI